MLNSVRPISIGLVGHHPAWKLLLDQIGISWTVIELIHSDMAAQHSVVIVPQSTAENEERLLQEYASSGGAVLYTYSHPLTSKKAAAKKYTTSLPPHHTPEYAYSDIFDIYGTVYLFEDGKFIRTEQIGDGIISYCGIDISSMVVDQRAIRKNFYAPTRRLPHELVSVISKNAIRQILQTHLEFLHHKRSLPFVHKWFFPNGENTLFTFRIDSDKGSKEQIDEIFHLGRRHDIPISWFLDVKSHEQWLDHFQNFDRQEIGIHCYEHATYNNLLLNKENFEKARTLLMKQNIPTTGMTVPTGAWNNAIGGAIRDLGFIYSSEFCYDYDNFPSFPVVDSALSPVLQLPVHPVCIGIMIREKMSIEEMVEYYKTIIDRKLLFREPICFYHHPTHKHNEVFEQVFQYMNAKKILKYTYREYAQWWKRRCQCSYSVSYDGVSLQLNFSQPSEVMLRISIPDSGEVIIAPTEIVRLDSLPFTAEEPPHVPPSDIMRARRFTRRHILQNALDWWIKSTE